MLHAFETTLHVHYCFFKKSVIAAKMMMRLSLLVASLFATATAFAPLSPFSAPALASRSSVITMARNPLKSLKIRTKRVANVKTGRLRLNIFRSNLHIYGQIINDVEHKTLAAGSTKALKLGNGGNIEAATAAGKALGEAAKAKGIEKLFFDRESADHKYKYHGRVAAFVEGVRETGVAV